MKDETKAVRRVVRAPGPGPGEVIPLVRSLPGVRCDATALYAALTDGGTRRDTLLLESLDVSTRERGQSFIIDRAAVRLTCVGQTVRVEALSDAGAGLLPVLRERLEAVAADVVATPGGCLATFAPPPEHASDLERLTAPSVFDSLREAAMGWRLRSAPLGAATLFIGGIFAYDLVGVCERLPAPKRDPIGFPDFVFWIPERVVVIDPRQATVSAVSLAWGRHDDGDDACQNQLAAAHEALDDLVAMLRGHVDGEAAREAAPSVADPSLGDVQVDVSDADYAALVEQLKEHIVAGDVFQIVPSRTYQAPCPQPLEAYRALGKLNPSPYMFYVACPEHTVFGASPETSVKVSGAPRKVEIRPIAGTARRGRLADGSLDRDLDSRLETALRLDAKELAEHMMLIDLARNDVARVCVPGSRHVPRILTVDRYSHVMHLVSHVEGELRPELDALHAYAASMNMGTLVGAPKIRAAQLLREVEETRRGPYGGAVGYLSWDGEMDTAIIIRSALVRDGVAYVRAGAGVVHDSVPASEADETRRKASAVLRALETARGGSL